MKNFPGTAKLWALALGLGFALITWSCATGWGERDTSRITIEKAGILIPGTVISKADQEQMNAVLSKYHRSLYKVQTYQNGVLAETRGRLKEGYIGRAKIIKITDNARRIHLSGCALQVGFEISSEAEGNGGSRHSTSQVGTPPPKVTNGSAGGGGHNAQPSPEATAAMEESAERTPQTGGQTTGSHQRPPGAEFREAEKLVRELRPILEKYTKK